MRCRDVEILIPEFVMGGLDEENLNKVTAHAKLCPACRRQLEETQQLLAVTRATLPKSIDAPEEYFGNVWGTLYQTIQEAGLHRRTPTVWERIRALVQLPAAVRMPLINTALALLVIAALFTSLRQDENTPPSFFQDFRNEIAASGAGRIGRSLQQGRDMLTKALSFGTVGDTEKNLETVIDVLYPDEPEGETYDKLTDYLAQMLVKLDKQV